MNAKIPVIMMVLVACGQLACAQSPQLYVPSQVPQPPGYAPAAAAPVQPPPVQPMAQQQPAGMYDQSYRGPYNVYGQPVITGYKRQQDIQQDQGQTIHNGILPKAVQGVGGFGSYLWSYMPAPLRGAGSPYDVPPGQTQTTVNFVPGAP
ncbi:MAG: hypothetical protein V1792_25790 [Pseudomonadota bacterium]